MAISVTSLGSAYTQNFDTLSNVAGSTTNTLAIPGWALTESGGGARDNEQYAVDTGSSNTGDTYSYGAAAATDRALGSLRSGTLIPTFGAFFTNDTGGTINSLDISYFGEQWRLGTAARTDQLSFEYQAAATDGDLVSGTWTPVSALSFSTVETTTTGAKDGNVLRSSVSSTISGLSIAPGATFAIRWVDADASSADDGLAVDDFSLTANAAPADTTPPTFTSPATFEAAENQSAAGDVDATDPSTPITYSIVGGADQSLFAIDPATGALSFVSAPDFEAPADAGADNVYDVTVRAADASNNTADQAIQVTVTDVNESLPNLSVSDPTVAEGDGGTVTLTFAVTLDSPAPAGGVTFDIATADGTAVAGSDYAARSLTAQTIPAGSSSYAFDVTVNGDTAFEGDETVVVNVTNVTGANIADAQGLGTISNDDAAPLPLINEIDADQSGTDAAEFIELFGGANASLNGYTLVLYNGSSDTSYAAFDLDGFSFDANGYFVVGNAGVPSVDLTFAGNFLQNGADAVALYQGDAADFPNGTAVTATGLVDAVVYENGNPDDYGLIDVLTPGQVQVNENERGSSFTQSLQRTTDGAGGPRNTTAFVPAPITPGAANAVPITLAASGTVSHLISQVQGAGAASPLVGSTVTIEGVVVGDFQSGDAEVARSLNGFYLQEEVADSDANPLTSEGVFVFGGLTDVNEGDQVRVTGTVAENFGMTQVNVTGVTVVSTGNDIAPLRVDIDLPAAGVTTNQEGDFQPDLEAFEGMLVRIPETLTITEQFQLDRFNEIKLVAGSRPETYTNEFEPNAAGYSAYLQEIGARTITYDDGLNTQNESINLLDGFDPNDNGRGPSPTLPNEPGYSTATAFRMGDTVSGLTGVLDYQWAGNSASGSTWRIRSIDDGDNTFVEANPRPETPPSLGASLTVGSFNVLNYFVTLSGNTGVGLSARGANNQAELDRQTAKLVEFIRDMNADILGLTELENDFFDSNPNDASLEGNAVGYLVQQLNASATPGDEYAYINPGDQLTDGQFFGGDAIAVGFIYKPSKVTVALDTTIQKLDDSDPEAAALLGQSTIGAIFNGPNTSRAALAVTFEEVATGEDFTAVVNHFKSKGGTGTGADANQLDGQGSWQNQRELAAEALVNWIANNPTGTADPDVMLLGDFNAYIKEDALDIIKAGTATDDFHNVAEERTSNPYSFVFDGQFGSLDHIFVNNSLNSQVISVDEWHINADEADALDYNLDFDRDPTYFDPNSPARQSDHDPIIVGLALDSPSVSINDASIVEGDSGPRMLTFTVTRAGGSGAFGVNYSTADGTAAAGSDYTAASGVVNFATGETSKTISISVLGDTSFEGDETFNVVLSNASSGATIADGSGAAMIRDDDLNPANGIAILQPPASLEGQQTPTATDAITIARLGSFSVAGGNAESVAFDPTTDRIYVTNGSLDRVDIVQVAADGTLSEAGTINLAGLPNYGSVNSVAAKNGLVAVAFGNANEGQPGTVALFGPSGGAAIRQITVGVLPDHIAFTPDGQRLLVANEAEAISAINNPAGSISIIDLSGGAASASVSQTTGFGVLNGQELALTKAGLALFPGQEAARDIEPEYITVSPDGARAYVTLQEVNAVAVLDLTDPAADRPLALLPLGGVDRSLPGNAFDGNDRSGGPNLVTAPITSLLQPDAIASFAVGGQTYFITANEGDARAGDLDDEARLQAVSLDPTAFPNAAALQDPTTGLGRLNVLTHIGDTDGDGDLDQIYAFGGRGISIFRQNADGTVTKVRETGGEFEAILALNYPERFNIDGSDNGGVDNRSDNKGPEPESVTVGEVAGRTYAFVGLERVGGYMVYDVTDPETASFVRYQPNQGDPRTGPETAPEVVAFVSATDSPTGNALVISANEVGGSVTVDAVLPVTSGGPLAETVNGGAGVDVFSGGGGDDVLRGLGGDDRLFGDAGADRLFGGADDDYLDGGADNDVVIGEDGDDILVGGSGGLNQLHGRDGNDTVDYSGRAGSLFVDLRAPAGRIDGVLVDTMNSIENVMAGLGNAVLIGNGEVNRLVGGAGNDALYGLGGDDVLIGGSVAGGRNQLWGGTGSDTASYEGSVSRHYASIEGRGGFIIDGQSYALVETFNSIENLVGGGARDVLIGDATDNLITGGGGADQLYGRAGADTFVFRSANDSRISTGYDTVADFLTGQDRIDLSALGIDASRVQIASNATNTVLYADTDPGAAGFELAISFVGANVATVNDIIF